MMRRHLLTMSTLISCVLLVPWAALGAEGHLLLVSLQKSSYEQVCRFYSLDLKTSSIAEVRKLAVRPPVEIFRVDAYPSLRKAIVWVEKPAPHEIEAHILNVDQLAETERVALPAFGPDSRCYYLDSATSAPVLAVENLAVDATRNTLDPARNKLYAAFRGEGSGLTGPKDLPSVDGRSILLPGVSSSRFGESQSISLRYDKVGKKFVEMAGSQIKVDFPLDEKTAVLIEAQPARPTSPRLMCNDSGAAIIVWGVPREDHVEARRYIFEKSTGTWKPLIAKEDASRPLMFGKWVAIQEECARGGGVFRMTGEFAFYSRDEDTSFTWQATRDEELAQDVEILGMWEKDFVYRVGTKIYMADIANGKVANERLVFASKASYSRGIDPIEEIHWVFRMLE